MVAALVVLAAAVTGASGVTDGGVSIEDAPEDAFAISGSPDFLYGHFLYGRGTELRWSLDQDVLAFQTTRNQHYRVEVLTPNVIRLCSTISQARCHTPKYLIRVGSPEYERMAAFRKCMETNRGKPLFEVKECPLPFPVEPAEG